MQGQEELNEQVSVVSYDPGWADLFEQEATALHNLLGSRIDQIEHIWGRQQSTFS